MKVTTKQLIDAIDDCRDYMIVPSEYEDDVLVIRMIGGDPKSHDVYNGFVVGTVITKQDGANSIDVLDKMLPDKLNDILIDYANTPVKYRGSKVVFTDASDFHKYHEEF